MCAALPMAPANNPHPCKPPTAACWNLAGDSVTCMLPSIQSTKEKLQSERNAWQMEGTRLALRTLCSQSVELRWNAATDP
jgi:hypothetical protein